jgi:ABC-type polysaccharide/polyol phosphate transport system ATPase subunit
MTVIKVENLTKIYKLYDRPQDRLKESLHPFRKQYHRDFYALRDVSFEVQKGETVGIIGKNGSGKSTLLKIITGLLTPSSGNVEVNGKVSSLLELGAGFNPEFTGMENIYLNGTIMGYSKEEMDNRLDDILLFADIGEFVYQQVKTYSSGMFVRLAFAVAINVDPDILIIDEALAVGDIRFQQKCYRKIREFCQKGKTIFFCTHDMGAVLNLCSRCIWFNDGEIKEIGLPEEIVKKYTAYMYYDQEVKVETKKNSNDIKDEDKVENKMLWKDISKHSFFGEGGAQLTQVCFIDQKLDQEITSLKGGEKVILGIRITTLSDICNTIIGFNIKNSYGVNAYGTNTFVERYIIQTLRPQDIVEVFFSFPLPLLSNGTYSIDIAIADGTQVNHIQQCWKYDVMSFDVMNIGEKFAFGYIYVDSKDINIEHRIISN